MSPDSSETLRFLPPPPDCQLAGETFKIACEGCPFAPECGYLALSQKLDTTRKELEDSRLRRLEEKIEDNCDGLIPGFYNRRAVLFMLENDETLANELTERRCAIVMIDARGVHAVNERDGFEAGDKLIVAAGTRLMQSSEGVRSGLNPLENAQAKNGGHPAEVGPRAPDIGIRDGKADELYILIRDITPAELVGVVARVERSFSVDHSIEDAENGRLPIPATVSSMHCAELSRDLLSVGASAKSIFVSTYAAVRVRHDKLKAVQYAEMWDRVCDETNSPDRPTPLDTRMIYGEFVDYCCTGLTEKV